MSVLKPYDVAVGDAGDMGLGVFATRDFKEGEVVERFPAIMLHTTGGVCPELVHYAFPCPSKEQIENGLEDEWFKGTAIPTGNGMLYNHSDDPNVDLDCEIVDGKCMYQFVTTKPIARGEQIFWHYGGGEKVRFKDDGTFTVGESLDVILSKLEELYGA